jgi:hypothetical protein
LKNKKSILLLLLLSLLVSAGYAQKKKNAALQQKKHEFLKNLQLLEEKGQLDSMLIFLRNEKNPVDTSLHIYQTTTQKGRVVEMIVLEGDTLYEYNMATFTVVDLQPYKDKEKDLRFRRIKWHVNKVYPYAIKASNMLIKYTKELEEVKSKRKRRKLMKAREKVLKVEFEDVIKKMSRTSGRVLVKLIDRETGESTYDIIKEMRGGFKAWVYQGVGKFYGANLKLRYNPAENEEDEMIERVVQSLIEKEENGKD